MSSPAPENSTQLGASRWADSSYTPVLKKNELLHSGSKTKSTTANENKSLAKDEPKDVVMTFEETKEPGLSSKERNKRRKRRNKKSHLNAGSVDDADVKASKEVMANVGMSLPEVTVIMSSPKKASNKVTRNDLKQSIWAESSETPVLKKVLMHSKFSSQLPAINEHESIEEPKDVTMSWADEVEDAPSCSQRDVPMAIDRVELEVEVTVPESDTIPPSHPLRTLKMAQKVHIILTYRELTGKPDIIAIHAAQIKYLMEAAKMLGVNKRLKGLSLQLANPSCELHHRQSIVNLIRPFLLFVRNVKLTLSRRRWRPDNTWYEPGSTNVLPADLERLFRWKCEERAHPLRPHETREMVDLEKKVAKAYDDNYYGNWLSGSLIEAMEVKSQIIGKARLSPNGAVIGGWPGWEKSV